MVDEYLRHTHMYMNIDVICLFAYTYRPVSSVPIPYSVENPSPTVGHKGYTE